jgi:hypothetical protein
MEDCMITTQATVASLRHPTGSGLGVFTKKKLRNIVNYDRSKLARKLAFEILRDEIEKEMK